MFLPTDWIVVDDMSQADLSRAVHISSIFPTSIISLDARVQGYLKLWPQGNPINFIWMGLTEVKVVSNWRAPGNDNRLHQFIGFLQLLFAIHWQFLKNYLAPLQSDQVPYPVCLDQFNPFDFWLYFNWTFDCISKLQLTYSQKSSGLNGCSGFCTPYIWLYRNQTKTIIFFQGP